MSMVIPSMVIDFLWHNKIYGAKALSSFLVLVFELFILSYSARAQFTPAVAQRFNALEREWLNENNVVNRKKANEQLEPLLLALFTGQTGKASEIIDDARRTCHKTKAVSHWVDSLQMTIEKSTIDAESDEIEIKLKQIYGPAPPEITEAKLWINTIKNGKIIGSQSDIIPSLPHNFLVKSPKLPGKLILSWSIQVNGKPIISLPRPVLEIVCEPNLMSRVKKLSEKRNQVEKMPCTIARQTWLFYHECLIAQVDGTPKSYDMSIDDILNILEMASFRALISGKWPIPTANLDTILVIPGNKADIIVRVILPENFKTSVSKYPLLVALHGAGNSESQFVIGHASQFVTRCSQNGWILACPRNGIATDLQTQLDSWLGVTSGPIALIGHSQGAAQALAFAAKKPGNVRAVVALGGSGRIGDGADYQKINFFLGIGSQDVAVKAVSNLAAQLRTIAPSKVEFLNYEGIGHLLIVVAAMDDTFKFLEKSLRTSSDSN